MLLSFLGCSKSDAGNVTPAPTHAPADVAPTASVVTTPDPVVARPDPIRIETVDVPGDLRALVLRGEPRKHRFTMVFLHGRCVYPGYYVESFMNAAAARGDLVAVQGDVSCGGDNFLHTWSLDIAALDRRIAAALAAAQIDGTREVVLVGYSQGADRAEALAAQFPTKYRAVVLIASSSAPSAQRLRGVRAAVLIAGTQDLQTKMQEGLVALRQAQIPVTFIQLPGAWHGHMGTAPEITMGRALDFAEVGLGR